MSIRRQLSLESLSEDVALFDRQRVQNWTNERKIDFSRDKFIAIISVTGKANNIIFNRTASDFAIYKNLTFAESHD